MKGFEGQREGAVGAYPHGQHACMMAPRQSLVLLYTGERVSA